VKLLERLPLPLLVVLSLTLGLAPFTPQPHLFEKLQMLFASTLTKPVDIFDLIMHGTPVVLLVLKVFHLVINGNRKKK